MTHGVACTQMSFGVQMTPRGRVHTLDYSVSLEAAPVRRGSSGLPGSAGQADKNGKNKKRSCNRELAGRENPENEKRSCKVWLEAAPTEQKSASTFPGFAKS